MNATSVPRPIWARLAITDAAKAQMGAARGRRAAKRALESAHNELAESLVPKLQALRQQRRVIDFATSWLLGEVVVHVEAAMVEEMHAELAAFPELRDVTSDDHELRKRLRAIR